MVASCGLNKEEEEIENVALRFSQCFFECKYKEAASLCTHQSEKWIKFAATNISDSDLVVFNQSQAIPQYSVTDVNVIDDSTVSVKVEVENYLSAQSIDHKACIKPQGMYTITLRKQTGTWKVDLSCVPQEDKECH